VERFRLRRGALVEKRRLAFAFATRGPAEFLALARENGWTPDELEEQRNEIMQAGPDVWDDVLVELEEMIRCNAIAGQLPLGGAILGRRMDDLRNRNARTDPWTEEDDTTLLALVGGVNEAWCGIGQILRRSPIACWLRHQVLMNDRRFLTDFW
jgi:hypothetical protein